MSVALEEMELVVAEGQQARGLQQAGKLELREFIELRAKGENEPMTKGLTAIGGQDIASRAPLAAMGQAANEAAARHSFADYRSRKAERTVKRQDGDLAVFAEFLAEAGVSVGDLSHDPEAWRDITWGLVESFVKWQLHKGYSVGTVNIRLSTVKTYCKLAMKAGTLPSTEYSLIRAVQGYSHKEAKRIDENREAANVPTRKGAKKAEPVSISQE